MHNMLQPRQEQRAHDQPLPVGRQHEGGAREGARAKGDQVPTVAGLFQMRRAAFDMREVEQRRAGKGLRRGWEGGGMSILRGVVGGHIWSQTRIPRGVEEVVRHRAERCAVEGKHGPFFGIVDRRRRGDGVSGGAGIHVLHGGDLINDRA